MADDLFASPRPERAEGSPRAGADYNAHSIEVLEGLEPVRRRPGMYVGGTDERALHHEQVRMTLEILSHDVNMAYRLIAAPRKDYGIAVYSVMHTVIETTPI